MIRKIICAALCLCLLLSAVACKKEETALRGYSFEDDLGRAVTVSEPLRVAALLGSFADLWMLAGGTVCASADDAWEDLGLKLPKETVNLGSTHAPSKEQLFLSSPQLVLASSKLSKHLELREALDAAGIPVAYFDVSDFDSFLHVFKILTDITGRGDLYELHGEGQRARIDALLERNRAQQPQRVLVLRASATSIRAKNSDGTMLGGMLRDFGCINIADSDAMLLEHLSLESIALQNPHKLFFVEAGDHSEEIRLFVEKTFVENPLWQSLDAVKNGEVYFMEKELYNLKPNASFALAYEKLEGILYEK